MEPNNNHKRALIVDDEIDICYLLSGILKRQNLETTYVNTLSEAKKALAHDTPNILILDNHLPDGLGLNFIHEVKSTYPQVKIIMLTAYDTSLDKHTAYQQGVDGFIGKPFTKAAITNTVAGLIS